MTVGLKLRLRRTPIWYSRAQTGMRTSPVVVRRPGFENLTDVRFVEWNHEIQTVQNLCVGRPVIAVRPVAAVHQPVLPENVPEFIQSRSVEIQVARNFSTNITEDFRDLDVNLRPFPKLSQISLKRFASRGFCGRFKLRQVIDH